MRGASQSQLTTSRAWTTAISVIVAVILLLQVAKVKGNVDEDALSSLKNSLVDPQNVLESWDTSLVDPCTWFHVSCNDDNRVTDVTLLNSNLSGQLVSDIAKMDQLRILLLQGNHLTGPIPSELGDLPNLVSLWVFSYPK
ncbi:Leucine-rich repeat protein 1 [Linum grandiflorum]